MMETSTRKFNERLSVVQLVNGQWEARLDSLDARGRGNTREQAGHALELDIAEKLQRMGPAERVMWVMANTAAVESCETGVQHKSAGEGGS